MEFLEQNGSRLEIPVEVVSMGRAAVQDWCDAQGPQGPPGMPAAPSAPPITSSPSVASAASSASSSSRARGEES